MRVFQIKWAWFGVLVMVLFLGVRLQESWRWNKEAVLFLQGKEEPSAFSAAGCDHILLAVAEVGRDGKLSSQRQIWEQALDCSPYNLPILMSVLPKDIGMAKLATQRYPNILYAWFWVGEAINPSDNLGARQVYLQTVALAPSFGLAWCHLGSTYERDSEFEKASEAYLNCCTNGDPGANGCYGAGRMMEKLGNLQKAIEYYHLSSWEGALKRADELENQVNP